MHFLIRRTCKGFFKKLDREYTEDRERKRKKKREKGEKRCVRWGGVG